MEDFSIFAEKMRQIVSQVAGHEVTLTEDISRVWDVGNNNREVATAISLEFDVDVIEEMLSIYDSVNAVTQYVIESGGLIL